MSRTTVLQVRVEPQLLEAVKNAARNDSRSVSDWVRLRLLAAMAETGTPELSLPIPGQMTVEEVEAEVLEKLPVNKHQAKVIAQAHADIAAGKPVRDDCTHRASHARTIREGAACKGCGGTTW